MTSSRLIIYVCAFVSLISMKHAAVAQAQDMKAKPDSTMKDSIHADTAKGSLPPYEKIITEEAVSQSGLFTVHRIDNKWWFEVGDSLLGRDLLMVTRLAKAGADMRTGTGMGGYAGDQVNETVVRWEKGPKGKLFIRRMSYSEYAGDTTQAMFRAVAASNIQPIAAVFDVKAISPDSAGVVVEVTEYLDGDNDLLFFAPSAKSSLQLGGLQADKSYISAVRVFPQNIGIRTVKTYAKAPQQSLFDPTGALAGATTATVELSTSIVQLPAKPMQPRHADSRVGYFTVGYTDFGRDPQGVARVNLVKRWRLEPRDWAAYRRGELVEPVKPIVFYIDPATPKQWVPYLMQGVDDWQAAFEKAGFKNAIYALEAPTKEQDSTWSLEDARFSAIVYKASAVPNASGPSIADPRTGEILESHINWYHNVMRLLRNWYFIQGAPVDKRARRMTFDDELMGQLIRFVSSHEVGHTLGLLHNFGASSTTPVEKLRDRKWLEAHGHTPSIMDYARFNYVAQPEDNVGVRGLLPRLGDYDLWAIEWGYRLLPQYKDAEAETAHLNRWVIEKNEDPRLWFGHERNPDDPRSQSEDMGDNAMLASEYGIRNLKRVVENLPAWTKEPEKDYAALKELYDETMKQYMRYVRHVAKNIGGVYETPKTVEQSGTVYAVVPKATQREAVAFLNAQLFATPMWLVKPEIHALIGGNPVASVGASQQKLLGELLKPERMQKLIGAEAQLGADAYTLTDLVADVQGEIWKELQGSDPVTVYRRNLQKAYVNQLVEIADPAKSSGTPGGMMPPELAAMVNSRANIGNNDIPSVAKAYLRQLQRDIDAALPIVSESMTQMHLEDCRERIEKALDPKPYKK